MTLREQIVEPAAAGLFTEEQARLFRALPYASRWLPIVAIADRDRRRPASERPARRFGREDARFVVTACQEAASRRR